MRVIDRLTKTPVPGADVWWANAATWDRIEALPEVDREPFEDDIVLALRTFGSHALTTSSGAVRLSADANGTQITVQSDGRQGWRTIEPYDTSGPVTIAIEQELTVTVRVVDGAGRPAANAPVALELPDAGETGVTDPTGLVRFKQLQHDLARDEHDAPIAANGTVRIGIPGLAHIATSFPALSPPTEPIVLRLPSTGQLQVRLLHPGREVSGVEARLRLDDSNEPQARATEMHLGSQADGDVRFPWLPLGQVFQLQVQVGELTLQKNLVGPARPGQCVYAILDLPSDEVSLVGRVIRPDGSPLASEHVWLSGEPESWASFGVRTDSRGRFVWFPHQALGDAPSLVVSWQRGWLDTLHGRVLLERMASGVVWLGDVHLDQRPLLVSGGFQGDRKVLMSLPLDLSIERWIDDPATKDGSWQAEPNLDVERGGRGEFVVRGNTPPGRLRLTCSALARPVEFERGTQGLVIPVGNTELETK